MPGLRNVTNFASAARAAEPSTKLRPQVVGMDRLKHLMEQQSAELQHLQGQVLQVVPVAAAVGSTGSSSLHQRQASRMPLALLQKLPAAQDVPLNMFAWDRQKESDNCQSHASSGSDHEPSSVCLAALVSDFMEVDGRSVAGGSNASRLVGSSDSCRGYTDDEDEDSGRGLLELTAAIENLGACTTNLERKLFSDVVAAMKLARGDAAAMALQEASSTSRPGQPMPNAVSAAAAATSASSPFFRRAVMGRLRLAGYNAAVCKSRWEHARGFPGGDYEYIDIVFSSDSSHIPKERLLVDIDFRAQFQVARPTADFDAVLHSAPIIFVGRVDRLQQLVDVLSDACRRSMRSQGMHLPPWRRVEYLRSKWLSPYKRTTNVFPTQPTSQQAQNPKQATSSASNPQPAPRSTAGFVRGVPAFALPPTPSTRREGSGAGSNSLLSQDCRSESVRRGGLAQQITPRGCLGMLLRQQMMPGMEQSRPMPPALLGGGL